MSWLVDNAWALYVLLGLIAVAMVLIWHNNRQNHFLAYAGVAIASCILIWVLMSFVPSDRKQIEENVRAMGQAVMDGKVDDLFKHISNDFAYHTMTRDNLYKATRAAIERHSVHGIHITKFKVEELSREKKTARASFNISGSADGGQFFYRVETDFVLEGDKWMLKTMRFYNPVANQDQELRLPGI